MKRLIADQLQANKRILAWLEDRPYREYPGQIRPRVPSLKDRFVLKTYTPRFPEWSEQFFTPLPAAVSALEEVIGYPKRMFEPCAGIGHLLMAMKDVRLPCDVDAFEIEETACRIGQKLFPWANWRHGNVFDFVGELEGKYDLFVCNPPFGGGDHLKPANRTGWISTKTEHLFLELAARVLEPGGQAVMIAPDRYLDGLPDRLISYLVQQGLQYGRSKVLPSGSDFLQTSVEVRAYYFEKE